MDHLTKANQEGSTSGQLGKHLQSQATAHAGHAAESPHTALWVKWRKAMGRFSINKVALASVLHTWWDEVIV